MADGGDGGGGEDTNGGQRVRDNHPVRPGHDERDADMLLLLHRRLRPLLNEDADDGTR